MDTSLQTQGPLAMQRPSFIKEGDTRGTENIGSGDIRPPALRIAQSGSPEAKRSEKDKYIPGLVEGMFYNSTTKQIYGEGPVGLVVINQLGHRNVEFDPNDKKVVLDFNVPDDDPRTQFSTAVIDGVQKRLKPRATCFYDYLILVVVDGKQELMTMSLKSTQLKKAKDLNTVLKGSKMPAFAFMFEVSPAPEHRGGNSWYGWTFKPTGHVTEKLYAEASEYYDKMTGKQVVVEAEGDDEPGDHIPF